MIEAYKKMFTNYANFKDRTSRRDYWLAVLMNVIVSLGLGLIVGLIDSLSFLTTLYALAVLVPSLAMSARRMHDINKSGWTILLELIPLVGSIIVLVFECLPSVDENNNRGVKL